ncbi:putative beta-glucan synthesis-associated protein [Zancudomyces culisetae]|uniref:Putative beta-glucan synthesis-associated protein n=1 Tax=Zancudomyces culisetae TaxID=1213189 RepID=A0A1R1PPE3_ZANCU|nr:putative beta-glucan synthesis-associated protein [Zancudomyces culisetae]|eukprot:OMH82811.1 putative beta-glucan synthesis-associated protein [Zancudomyces culisetae]
MNLGISHNFAHIEFDKLELPTAMYVDYVRLYQHPDRIRLSCDPPDRPTSQYIIDHPLAYYNYKNRSWRTATYKPPEYSLDAVCNAKK